MSKVAHYLQEHLLGEVMTSPDVRRFFSTDGSILSVVPNMVVYPRSEGDVRKVARFAWQLAERGRVLPITARGAGTDQSGAALGSGILLAFTAHMNRIIEFDSRSGNVIIEPGINYGKLQQTLETHNYFLPPYPASFEYSTVGGAIANNAGGEKSVKYGDTRAYVKSLRVVLANGEVIETGRLAKRDVSKKLGLATFEGEIYRAIDTLLEEVDVSGSRLSVAHNTAGYDLVDVRHKDGSLDLTPLLVGAQGTLGIITEATLTTKPFNPETSLFVAGFDSIAKVQSAVSELVALSERPSAIEMVDGNLLDAVSKLNPNQLKNVVDEPFPAFVLLIELDEPNERQQKRVTKKVRKILQVHSLGFQVQSDPLKQEELWKIRHAPATLLANPAGRAKAVPVVDDGIVPLNRLTEYLEGLYELLRRTSVRPAVWGPVGDGEVHVRPYIDLAEVGDRQKVFRLLDEYYKLVMSLGGSTSGKYNDGRLRAPYLPALYGAETYNTFEKVKKIFDPYGTLNPGVKIGVTLEDIKPLMRHEYNLEHLYLNMPWS